MSNIYYVLGAVLCTGNGILRFLADEEAHLLCRQVRGRNPGVGLITANYSLSFGPAFVSLLLTLLPYHLLSLTLFLCWHLPFICLPAMTSVTGRANCAIYSLSCCPLVFQVAIFVFNVHKLDLHLLKKGISSAAHLVGKNNYLS